MSKSDTGYYGVAARNGSFVAYVQYKGKMLSHQPFDTAKEAARWRDACVRAIMNSLMKRDRKYRTKTRACVRS